MSFILQILTSTEPANPRDATTWLDATGTAPAESVARMNSFVAQMRTVTVGTARANGDDSFWPEELKEVSVAERAYNVAANVAQLTHPRMAAVALIAAEHGLQILDPQNGLLWRADGNLVNLKGQAAPFAPAATLKPRKVAAPPLDGVEIMRHLISFVKPLLTELGFKHEEKSGGRNADHKFRRQAGDVLQEVQFGLFYERTWGTLRCTVGFDSAVLHRRTPAITEFAAAYLKYDAFYRPLPLGYQSRCLHPLAKETPALHKLIKKTTNLETVGKQMGKWLTQWLEYGLQPASTLKGLAEFALSDAAITDEMRGWFGRDQMRLAVLMTLAAMYKPEQATALMQALEARMKANPDTYFRTSEDTAKREALLAHIAKLQPETGV